MSRMTSMTAASTASCVGSSAGASSIASSLSPPRPRIFVGSIFAFAKVPQQFFPRSERPELFAAAAAGGQCHSAPPLAVVKEAEALLEDDRDIATWTAYVGARQPALLAWLEPAAAERGLRRDRHPVARRRSARTYQVPPRGGGRQGRHVGSTGPGDRFNFGPPVGYPVQFRVIGPDPQKVREIAWRGARRDAPQRPMSSSRISTGTSARRRSRLEVDQERARALGLDAAGHGGRRFRPC